jgi:polysaccharide biosynthesis protein PslH
MQHAGSTVPANGQQPKSPHAPVVVIFGPPWPRSGTTLVMKNQVQYYRDRGFYTIFIAVPFLWHYVSFANDPKHLVAEMSELGADRTLLATLNLQRYKGAKYRASLRHAFRGTALDWIVAMGRAARLMDQEMEWLRLVQAPLFHVNHVYTMGFVLALRKQLYGNRRRPPILLETHDVQSQFLYQKKERNPWTRKPDSLERLMRAEIALMQKSDALIHVSVDDLQLFRSRLPKKPHFLVFPTIDENLAKAVNQSAGVDRSIDLLFLGQWHQANVAAMKWFFEQVWPLIENRQYRLSVLGQIGALLERECPEIHARFRHCFLGEVADLAPYYRRSRCVIAPMVSGTGISIKTIEALALGKPFVGTSKAFRGMPIERLRQIGRQTYDSPELFASGVIQSLSHEREAGMLSRTAYEEMFSTKNSYKVRDKTVELFTASGQICSDLHPVPLVSQR